jgi:hypothetical protein
VPSPHGHLSGGPTDRRSNYSGPARGTAGSLPAPPIRLTLDARANTPAAVNPNSSFGLAAFFRGSRVGSSRGVHLIPPALRAANGWIRDDGRCDAVSLSPSSPDRFQLPGQADQVVARRMPERALVRVDWRTLGGVEAQIEQPPENSLPLSAQKYRRAALRCTTSSFALASTCSATRRWPTSMWSIIRPHDSPPIRSPA